MARNWISVALSFSLLLALSLPLAAFKCPTIPPPSLCNADSQRSALIALYKETNGGDWTPPRWPNLLGDSENCRRRSDEILCGRNEFCGKENENYKICRKSEFCGVKSGDFEICDANGNCSATKAKSEVCSQTEFCSSDNENFQLCSQSEFCQTFPTHKLPLCDEINNDFCQWSGISCNEVTGLVVNISLSSRNLSGKIPWQNLSSAFGCSLEILDFSRNLLTGETDSDDFVSAIGEFSQLRKFSLEENEFSGNFVAEPFLCLNYTLEELAVGFNSIGGTISPSLSNLRRLQRLGLNNANFFGEFPEELWSLPELAVLYISNNNFQGTISKNISKMPNLLLLDLSSNAFSGTLPTELGVLRTLLNVDITSNAFTGTIPEELYFNGSFLRLLAVGENSLSGTISTNIGKLQSLQICTMNDNSFTGSIPSEIGMLKNLEYLGLSSNQLTGTLPPQISLSLSLSTLQCGGNRIQGEIPEAWGEMQSLKHLELSINEISGTLPPSILQIDSLTTLALDSNLLTGTLPPELIATAGLLIQHLELAGNNFTGNLPLWLGKLPNLQTLLLSGNSFTGTIPSTLLSLSLSISSIDLASNALTGTLAASLFATAVAKSLKKFDIGENSFTGTIPTEIGLLRSLELLDLSGTGNRRNGIGLSGTLPTEFFQLRNLTFLVLRGNNLSGDLPESLSLFPSLTVLDISYNEFTGTFPSEWTELKRLENLDVAGNRISGGLPSESYQWANLSSFNAEYNFLSSTVPQELSPCEKLAKIRLGNNFLHGTIPYGYTLLPLTVLEIGGNFVGGSVPVGFNPGLLVLDVAGNGNMTGSLPVAVLNNAEFMILNVTGLHLLRESPLDKVVWSDQYTYLQSPYQCAQPLWNSPNVQVIGLTPAFDNFVHCECLPGYKKLQKSSNGTNSFECELNIPPNREGLVLSLSIVIALMTVTLSVLLLRKPLKKWIQMRKDLRLAEALLSDYYAHSVELRSVGNLSDRLDKSLIVEFEDIRLVKTVATGASGTVSMAIWNHTPVAFKEYFSFPDESGRTDEMEVSDFYQETKVLAVLRHHNILQLLGVCLSPPATLTEWMDLGSLMQCIHSPVNSKHYAAVSNRHRVAREIARGMAYLHSRRILHRDLKSMNVVVGADGASIKVADFGRARAMPTSNSGMTLCAGTAAWMAPEMFLGGQYTEKCDVYSFGIILWELVTGEYPWEGLSFAVEIQEAVCNGKRPHFPSPLPHPPTPSSPPLQPLQHLAEECWAHDPVCRPDFSRVVERLEALVGVDGNPLDV